MAATAGATPGPAAHGHSVTPMAARPASAAPYRNRHHPTVLYPKRDPPVADPRQCLAEVGNRGVVEHGAGPLRALGPNHTSVNHGVGEYVNAQAHTNGLESFWSMMKRGYYGTYHRMSPAHLQRYVNEFAGRHNQCGCDTEVQMRMCVQMMEGKRLRYKDLAVGRDTLDATPYSG